MKYLVTMELIGTPPTSRQEFVRFMEEVVVPSLEGMIKLQAEGKVLAGGDLCGRRGWAAIMEAESNDQLSQILMTIPEWPLLEVDVIPLDSTEERLVQSRQFLERLKASSG